MNGNTNYQNKNMRSPLQNIFDMLREKTIVLTRKLNKLLAGDKRRNSGLPLHSFGENNSGLPLHSFGGSNDFNRYSSNNGSFWINLLKSKKVWTIVSVILFVLFIGEKAGLFPCFTCKLPCLTCKFNPGSKIDGIPENFGNNKKKNSKTLNGINTSTVGGGQKNIDVVEPENLLAESVVNSTVASVTDKSSVSEDSSFHNFAGTILIFSSVRCPACDKLKKDIADEALDKKLTNVNFRILDTDHLSEEDRKLAQDNHVHSLPTVLFLDATNKLLPNQTVVGADFRKVKDHAEDLNNSQTKELATTSAESKDVTPQVPEMVIFSASWCPACQQLKKQLSDSKLQNQLTNIKFRILDVDALNEADEKLSQQNSIESLPTILFFGTDGKLLADKTVIGDDWDAVKRNAEGLNNISL